MSFRVNMILDAERRSPIPFRKETLIWLGVVMVGFLISILTAWLYIAQQTMKARLDDARWSWEQLSPRYDGHLKIKKELAYLSVLRKDLESWKGARYEWSKQLDLLQDAVPAEIQLTELAITLKPEAGQPVAQRQFDLKVGGKISGASADQFVQQFLEVFMHSPLGEDISSAMIPDGAFRQDPAPDAGMDARVFEITAQYKPRRFQ
jgi:hypothetical protein